MAEPHSVFSTIWGREGWGARPALLGGGGMSYGEMLMAAEDLAGALQAAGVGEGSLVGVRLPVSPGYVIALLAAWRLGALSVLLDPQQTADEYAHIHRDAGLAFLIARQDAGPLPAAEWAAALAWRDLRIYGPFPEGRSAPGAGCIMIYTSGSTGRPKGVLLSDAGISSNVRAVADYLALAPQDRTIVFTVPSHAYAVSQILTHLWAGGAVLPWADGLLYPAAILRAVAEHRLTGLAANPTSFRLFDAVQLGPACDLGSVRYVMSTGQPLDARLARRMSARCPQARIVNVYGCSENSPRIAFCWLPADLPERDTPWPVGRPVIGTEIRVAGEGGAAAPAGTVGEVWVRGSSLMAGYWQAPELTAAKLAGGWLHSGDLGFWDEDGNLNLVGRIDNVFSVGHEKVAPEEVEAVIRNVAGVEDAAVAPAPDPLLDNAVVALVVVAADEASTLRRVRSECIRRLSAAKVPRRIVAVPSLPRTGYGKLDRPALRRLAEAHAPGRNAR